MIAVFKREFRSYFNNMIGFVIIAVILLFFGLYFCVYNIGSGLPYFGIGMSSLTGYFAIIIPILTMRSLSDEKKTKTDQILMTSPVSVSQVIMGKYFAMLAVFFIPVVYSCIFPVILSFQKSHSLLIDFSTILAFAVMGAAYIAIGMFISSLTESQIISAIISFGVFFLMSIMPSLSSYIPSTTYINALGFCAVALLAAILINHLTRNIYAAGTVLLIMVIAVWGVYFINAEIYAGALNKILNIITFSHGVNYFSYGIFDVKQLVTFISVAFLFVFMTVQSVSKRRWN